MNLLKARVFLQKHKKIIIVSELGILFVILFLLCKSINKEFVINNPTMFGVLGTLLGAIIGGVFSLMGSVWVNSKQQRAVQNIKRKNGNGVHLVIGSVHNKVYTRCNLAKFSDH